MFSGIRLGDAYLNLYDLYQLKLRGGTGHTQRLCHRHERGQPRRRVAGSDPRAALRWSPVPAARRSGTSTTAALPSS